MITARELVKALEGRWQGGYGMARCPAHDDHNPSLAIALGGDGKTLLKCHAGCDQAAVIDALRVRGLWGDDESRSVPSGAKKFPRDQEARDLEGERGKNNLARDLWRKAVPAAETSVGDYLASRGLSGVTIPPTIRYFPHAWHKNTRTIWPAMIAAVMHWPGREIVAIHRTFLTLCGTDKAPVSPNRMMLGPVQGGAVRLCQHGPALAVTEGIETGLSVMMETGLPVWAALSARGIETLILPPGVREVTICADNDESGRGQQAAERAAARWTAQGRTVRIALPPEPGTDFNDLVSGAI